MYIYHKDNAKTFKKAGVKMRLYNTKGDCKLCNILYQEVDSGHFEEFINHKSAFIYYILEGKGEFIIEDKKYKVEAGDAVIIPPNTRFYYIGHMKQILVTAPAWDEKDEEIIRKIER